MARKTDIPQRSSLWLLPRQLARFLRLRPVQAFCLRIIKLDKRRFVVRSEPLSKQSNALIHNLQDYDQTRAAFSWTNARKELSGLPKGRGLNIAYECVDRHADSPRGSHLALRWLGKQGTSRDYSYDELRRLTNRFANLLGKLGISKGDRVFVLTGRIPELYIAALGTLKNGSVFCPLFSAFGPEPIQQRLTIGDGKVLVTTTALYQRRKIAAQCGDFGARHDNRVVPAPQNRRTARRTARAKACDRHYRGQR